MGEFKDANGKTRIGKFLQGVSKVGPGVLKLAGNLTGIGALKELGKALDGDTEMTEIEKQAAKAILDMELQEMQEVTKRHAADMTSDSWMSKNIRPLTLGFMIVSLTFLVFTDSASRGFKVEDAWIELYKVLLLMVFCFYFGGRTYEKISKMRSNNGG